MKNAVPMPEAIDRLAEATGFAKSTFYRWLKEGKIRFFRVGKKMFTSEAVIKNFLFDISEKSKLLTEEVSE